MPTTTLQKKSKLLTVLLAFLFGSVGAHRFYLKGGRDFWAWSQVLAMVLGVIGVALLWSTPSTTQLAMGAQEARVWRRPQLRPRR